MLKLYEEYNQYIYKLAWQHACRNVEVDDLVQEAWLKICGKTLHISQLQKPQQLAYLAAVVRNTACSFSRSTSHEVPLEYADKLTYCEAEILNRILDRKISIELFRKVWPCVPIASRTILERKFILNESDEEIAYVLGINKNSVRMYLSRAKKSALSVLNEYKDALL